MPVATSAPAALPAVDAKLAAVFDVLGDSVVCYDAEWRYLFVNPAAQERMRAVGIDPASVIGRVVWDVVPDLRGTKFEEAMRRAARERRTVTYEDYYAPLAIWVENRVLPGADGGVTSFSRDITARRNAMRQLHESEARYRALVEASPAMTWITTPAGTPTDFPAWRELTGQTIEELQTGRWVEAIHADDAPLVAAAWEQATREGRGVELRYRIRLVDGTYRWFEAHGVAVRDDQGDVREWVGVLEDIDERLRREEGLRFLVEASGALGEALDARMVLQALARVAVETLADGCLITLEDEGRFDHVAVASRDAERARLMLEMETKYPIPPGAPTGYARAIRTGEPELVPLDLFHDDLLPSIAQSDEHLRLLRAMQLYSGLVVPITAGTHTRGALTLVLYGPDRRRPFSASDLELATAVGRRVALALERARLLEESERARIRAEANAARMAALQTMTAALGGALTAADVGDVVTTPGVRALNARAGSVALREPDGNALVVLAASGYPANALQQFERIPLSEPFPLTDVVRSGTTTFLRTAAERDARYPHLAALRRENGGGAMLALPLRSSAGEVIGALGFNFDEGAEPGTDELSVAEALAQQCAQALDRARLMEAEHAARMEAEAANHAKAEFLRTMSHELRQPLNGIGGFLELLELELRGPLTPEQRTDLARIRRNQQHLLSLINDVLSFARLEAGRLEVDIERAPVAALLEMLGPMVSAQMAAKGVDFACAPCPDDLAVLGDRDRIVQICLNLLTNALRATPTGGRVTLATSVTDDQVRIHVQDTGVGIPADKIEAIFSPFTQLGRALNQPREGAGLGLSIARGLAEAQGGSLTVESDVGVGSTFTLTLPRSTREGERSPEPLG